MSEQGRIPVGEWIEIRSTECMKGFVWTKFKFKFFGEKIAIAETENLDECWVHYNNLVWRYPPDPKKELFNKMISEWKSESLENAYDTKDSLVSIEYMFNWLVENGYIEVDK